jgi:hypothetical protein
MTTVSLPILSSRPKPVRRWLSYAGCGLAVVVALAYTLLPWYVPDAWLAREAAAALTQMFGRPAHVARMSLSWTDGVCVEGVTVDDLPGPGRPAHLIQIDRVRFGLSPVKTLLRGKVDRIELDGPRLWISLLPDGHLNIDDLDERRQAGLPTFHYLLRNVVLHLNLPDLPAQCRMDMAEIRLDRRTGLLRVSGDATVRPRRSPGDGGTAASAGRFLLNGRIRVPRLKRGVKLTGGGELRWENLDLKEVPFRRLPRLGVESLEGHTEGYVRLEAFPDLGLDYDLRVRLEGVAVHRREESAPERIRDGLFAASGHWDPAVDTFIANTLDYEMPALRIRDAGRAGRPALVLDRFATEPLRLDLAGEVEDVERLRREFPLIDEALRCADLQIGKGGQFTLRYSQGPEAARAQLVVDAKAVSVTCGDAVRLNSGVEKRLAIDVVRSAATGAIDLREARLDLDDLHWTAQGGLVPPAGEEGAGSLLPNSGWGDVLHEKPAALLSSAGGAERSRLVDAVLGATAKVSFKTGHIEQLATYLPGVDRELGGGRRRGPLECSVSLGPGGRGPAFRLELSSPTEAELDFGDRFRKPPGVPLSASASWAWDPQHPGRWRDLAGRLVVGESRITLDGPAAAVEYALAQGEAGRVPAEAYEADVRVHLPFVVSRIEQLLPRLPWAARVLDEYRGRVSTAPAGKSLELAGDVGITLSGKLSYRQDDWAWQGEAEADLASTRMQFGGVFDKAAGAPASVGVGHRVVCAGGQIEHELSARAALPGMEVDGSYVISGAAAGAMGLRSIADEEVRLNARVSDARRALAVWPTWARELADRELAGRATMMLHVSRAGTGESVVLNADASGLQFAVPEGQAFVKAAGVPCVLEVRGHSDEERGGVWSLDPGEARLANCGMRWQGGEIALSPQWSAWWSSVRRGEGAGVTADRCWQAFPAEHFVQRIEVSGLVEAEADAALRHLTPAVDRWIDRLGLVGRVAGGLRIVATPASTRLSGRLDTTRAHVSVVLPGGTRFTKPIGAEASLAVDVERCRAGASSGQGGDQSVIIHEAVLTAGDNQADLSGQLDLRPVAGERLAPSRGSLHVGSTCRRLDRLQGFLPDLAWPPVRGGLAANLDFELSDGAWRVGPSDVTLRDVAFNADDIPVHADGRVEYSGHDVLCDSLALRAGTSEIVLSGRGAISSDSPVIQAGVHAPHLDIDELARLYQIVSSRRSGGAQPSEATSGSRVWDFLGRASLDIAAQVDRLQLTAPDIERRADLRAVSVSVSGHEGVIELPLQISVDGGVITGRIKFFLREGKPYFDVAYSAERIAPKDLVQAYVRRSFPGFVAEGPLTLIDRSLQRIGVPQAQGNYPVGSGEWIIDGGYVEGKAAPDWMTRIFPGLNLARYDFLRMHDWFTKQENGRVDHRMIFQGRYYHLYMEGHTDADRSINYEVGIDLLAKLDSKYWVESGQGRIPLFIKTGRIRDDGTLEAEHVEYMPMPRVIESVVQSNVVKTVYYALRKQVLNLMEKRRGVQ